jgi:hypothetical protein
MLQFSPAPYPIFVEFVASAQTETIGGLYSGGRETYPNLKVND